MNIKELMSPASLALLVALITAHLLCDFVLQDDAMVDRKRQRKKEAHLQHAVIHGVFAALACGNYLLWPIALGVMVSHAFVDYVKEYIAPWFAPANDDTIPIRRLVIFFADQLIHLAFLISLTAFFLSQPQSPQPFWWAWWGQQSVVVLVLISGGIVTTFVGGCVVAILVAPLLREVEGAPAEGEVRPPKQRGLKDGGKYIGLFERALIFLLIMMSQAAGIGLLIAAKSIFRFGELNDHNNRKEAEYITIGTLMSFCWAIAATLATARVVTLV